MTLNLQKVLRVACYLLAVTGFFLMVMPMINRAVGRYDDPAPFTIGIPFALLALCFFYISSSKTAYHPKTHPVLAGLLWIAAGSFGVFAVCELYWAITFYL
jgi:hypothetical protein